MPEKCPLVKMEWDSDIPVVCREQCEDLWEHGATSLDLISNDCDESSPCDHEVGFGGETLQPFKPRVPGGANRARTILNICVRTEADLSNEITDFYCRNA